MRLIVILSYQGAVGSNEARLAAAEGEALASNTGDLFEKYNMYSNVGVGYLDTGELDRAHNWFVKASSALVNPQAAYAHVALSCNQGELALAEGDLIAAADHFASAQQRWTPGMGRYLGLVSNAGLGLTALHSGNLSQARFMEDTLPELPDEWSADPSMIVFFRAKLFERRGHYEDGADLLSGTARLIETSQPANWIKLKGEEARMRVRHALPLRSETLEAAIQAAGDLGLATRIESLKALRRVKKR